MVEINKTKPKKRRGIHVACLTWLFALTVFIQSVYASGPIPVSYYYEEVCASCDGTKEFFELYNRAVSSEDKKLFQTKISTYNVFMDSCRVLYEEEKQKLDIPAGTSLPVLIIGDQWISGHDAMEAQVREILLSLAESGEYDIENESETAFSNGIGQTDSNTDVTEEFETKTDQAFWDELIEKIRNSNEPAVLLFSTNGCDDCETVKQWFSQNGTSCYVLEYNIIEKECLNELKTVFKAYEVPEEEQKVPAVFFGEQYLIGKEAIPMLADMIGQEKDANKFLLKKLEIAANSQGSDSGEDHLNIWTLAAAGLLAGFNPCSISMLLMLLSLLLSEKASVWKNGLLYLLGKYAAYISIGFVIFATASQISNQTMERVGNIMNLLMGILFAIAAAFYLADAVRVYRQDYGNIKTQLPVGLRRMNHNLIKRVSSAGGIMQPLMILVLGIVISFGEFFCTGQIYMASITYLLKDQVKAAIIPFFVYATAMSVPAVIMILLIQRTRNTDAVSDFMFRHLGLIKIFNAGLFALFAVYFLLF